MDTLKQLKSALDQHISEQSDELSPELEDLAFEAQQKAENSPFFDGLDRHIIRNQVRSVQRLSSKMDREFLMNTSEKLNQFLFEHETLDDRERDRDFFVAARSLSRLVEQEKIKRQLPVSVVTERLQKYLDERHQRWEVRMRYVQKDLIPQEWQKVSQKPFHKQLDNIAKLSESDAELKRLWKRCRKPLPTIVIGSKSWKMQRSRAVKSRSKNASRG